MLKLKSLLFVIILIFVSQESFGITRTFLDFNVSFLNSVIPFQSNKLHFNGFGPGIQIGKYSVFGSWRFTGGIYFNFCSSDGTEEDVSKSVINFIANYELRYSFYEHVNFTPYVGLGAGLTVLASDQFYKQPIGLGVNLLAGVYIPLTRKQFGAFELHFGLVSPVILVYFEGETFFPYVIISSGIGYKF